MTLLHRFIPLLVRLDRALWVFGVSFAVLVAGAQSTPYFADSPELAAGGILLGLSHAPSFPTYALWVKLVSLVPLGSLAFRASLVSAFCGALAVAQLFRLGRRWIGSDWVLSGVVGLFLLTPGFWLSAVRQEVYTLQLCISLGIVGLILDWLERKELRLLLGAGFLFGLGMGVHSLLTLALLPPIVGVLLLSDWRRTLSPRTLAWCVLAALLGLSVYLYLPLRSSVNPVLDWNDPERLSGFLDSFTKRRETGLFVSETGWLEKAGLLLRALSSDYTPVLVWLGGLGLVPLMRRGVLPAVLLLGLLATNATTMLMAPTYDADNPDAPGYLLLNWAVWALLMGGGLERLLPASLKPRAALGALMMLALGLSLWLTPSHFPVHEEARGRQLGLLHLEAAPRGALALVKSDAVTFQVWYLQWIEGRRPDVLVINRKGLLSSSYQAQLIQEDPGLGSAFAESGGDVRQAGIPDQGLGSPYDPTDGFGDEVARVVQTQGPRRALLWEAGSDNRWLRPFTRPWGPWLRIDPAPVVLERASHQQTLSTAQRLLGLMAARGELLDPRMAHAYEVVLFNLLNSLSREEALPAAVRLPGWEALHRLTGSAASGLAWASVLQEAGATDDACRVLRVLKAVHPEDEQVQARALGCSAER